MLVVAAKLVAHNDCTGSLVSQTALEILFVERTALNIVDSLLVLFIVEQDSHFFARH